MKATILLLALPLVGSVSGEVFVFNNRAAWEAAVAGTTRTTETFDTLPVGPANSTTVFPSGMTLVAGGGSISSTGWSAIGQGNGLICQTFPSLAGATIGTGAPALLAFGFDYSNHFTGDCGDSDPGTCYGEPSLVQWGSSHWNLPSTGGFGDGIGPGDFAFFGIVATSPSDIPDGRVQLSSNVAQFGIDRFTYVVPEPGAAHVTVPGTANPWLAGHPAGTTAEYTDSAPAQSPVMAANVEAGAVYRFTVIGSVGYQSGSSSPTPDGGAGSSHSAENGLAAFSAPFNSLIGVFLPDSVPASPAPAAFAYQPNSLLISPGLRQPFFIGNGLDSAGVAQSFVAPVGGTRLFLGTMDEYNWNNNTGSFSVQIIMGKPDISVRQTEPLSDGDNMVEFGTTAVGSSKTLAFTITNTGNATLADLAVTVSGDDAEFFEVGSLSASSIVAGGGDATFEVTFAPGDFRIMTASLHITSNDPNENPFDIVIRGTALSTSFDTDNDGLNDWAEYQMAALGFDWQVSQPALVATFNNGANDAGFYTAARIQALHVGKPLLQRDPLTGEFTLTIGVKKSVDLLEFDPFPFIAPGITINGTGELEFRFASPDHAAFFVIGAD